MEDFSGAFSRSHNAGINDFLLPIQGNYRYLTVTTLHNTETTVHVYNYNNEVISFESIVNQTKVIDLTENCNYVRIRAGVITGNISYILQN